jgi:hypothetical protein
MSHDSHTASNRNQDAERTLRDYLTLSAQWHDPFPQPVIEQHGAQFVVREDLLEVGSKARFGSYLVQTLEPEKPIVYVAPRFGYAGISLAWLGRKYGRRVVLFMPACKKISAHQAVAIEMGAIPVFYRIAAMPNLNARARRWASENNGCFVPLGLKHPLVTACIVRTAYNMVINWLMMEKKDISHYHLFQPMEVWTAMSTGVLSRALQIAWPNSKFHGVAVARNIQEGERGEAEIHSSPYEFAQNYPDYKSIPFPTCSNYDAKVWPEMLKVGTVGALMWNVAGNVEPQHQETFKQRSDVDWGVEPKLKL